jgi:hypothetical protein
MIVIERWVFLVAPEDNPMYDAIPLPTLALRHLEGVFECNSTISGEDLFLHFYTDPKPVGLEYRISSLT